MSMGTAHEGKVKGSGQPKIPNVQAFSAHEPLVFDSSAGAADFC
jgi:hypothetical protein